MAKGKYIFINSAFYKTRVIHAYEWNGECIGDIIYELADDEYPRYKSLCNGNKFLKITRIETEVSHVNQGVASALIRELIKRYKIYNMVLLCSPRPREGNYDTLRSITDLKKFYTKFGFKKTGELLPTMIRTATLPALGV